MFNVRKWWPGLLSLVCLVCTSYGALILPQAEPFGSYAVVVSEETAKLDAWQPVIKTLRDKYDAALVLYPSGAVDAALAPLKSLKPRYAAFVARPEEAGRSFVVAIHRLTRALDDDPYTDLRWGILTGYEPADALRIARRSAPLVINSAASSMGPGSFKTLAHGFASAETKPEQFFIKTPGGETEERKVDGDPVKALVDAFNTQSPDVFVTSGHATERDWQVIYNQHKGSFLHEKGQLYGLNSKQQRFDINSPSAKVYLPMGNCLIGHVSGRDCMATAWMHSGGVHQMFGYTAVTFHGYMGWGMGSFFNNQYSLSESFYFNNQSLIWELQQEFPDQAHINFDSFDHGAINTLARKHKIGDRKLMGHLWDRDTVAFYGDPAWVARHRVDSPAWTTAWQHEGENVEVTITVLADGTWGNRPLAIPFPTRLERIRGVSCSHEMEALVTDDFALLPVMGKERTSGDVYTLRFGAVAVAPEGTSADAAALSAATTRAPAPRVAHQPFNPVRLGLSPSKARKVALACRYAKGNAAELIKALRTCGEERVQDTAFLIANMPLRDLTTLSADYLIENVRYAQIALAEAPWKDKITPELYLEYVLPYASLSETRDDWRRSFYEKLTLMIAGCNTPGEAAVALNQRIYEFFNVEYHATKRPKPDQCVSESLEAGYASCTGLSILLVNACRAVGVPARIAGVGEWTDGPGNHTWVEVWDEGWHCLGAAESQALNDVWFKKGAAAADASRPMKRIYATRFSRIPLRFPMVWNPYATYVPAEDVTAWYKKQFGKTAL